MAMGRNKLPRATPCRRSGRCGGPPAAAALGAALIAAGCAIEQPQVPRSAIVLRVPVANDTTALAEIVRDESDYLVLRRTTASPCGTAASSATSRAGSASATAWPSPPGPPPSPPPSGRSRSPAGDLPAADRRGRPGARRVPGAGGPGPRGRLPLQRRGRGAPARRRVPRRGLGKPLPRDRQRPAGLLRRGRSRPRRPGRRRPHRADGGDRPHRSGATASAVFALGGRKISGDLAILLRQARLEAEAETVTLLPRTPSRSPSS